MTEKHQNVDTRSTQSNNPTPVNVTTLTKKEETNEKCLALYPSKPNTSNK